MISKEALAEAVTRFQPMLEKLNAEDVIITEFEFLTVLSFYIFKQQQCDIIVCEVGMGGLLDSTNLIPHPLCATITRIDLDHTAILGDTIEEIAFQKAGIIKSGGTTVTASQKEEAYAVIARRAQEEHNTLYRAEDIRLTVTDTSNGTHFIYRDKEMFLPLFGAHQIDNLRCALAVLEALQAENKIEISLEHIRDGLQKVSHPARFEKLHDKPTVILDGAHNPNGLQAFAEAVRSYAADGDKTLIIGILADKDSTSLHLLKDIFKRVIATDIDNPRALPAEDLAKRLEDIAEHIEVIHRPHEAFDKALGYGDSIFICGSLYLASEIRPHILNHPFS